MKVSLDKLSHKATFRFEGTGMSTFMHIEYAGRSVRGPVPSSPASVVNAVNKLLNELLPHVESAVTAIVDELTEATTND